MLNHDFWKFRSISSENEMISWRNKNKDRRSRNRYLKPDLQQLQTHLSKSKFLTPFQT